VIVELFGLQSLQQSWNWLGFCTFKDKIFDKEPFDVSQGATHYTIDKTRSQMLLL
jgi:hypothetical protein